LNVVISFAVILCSDIVKCTTVVYVACDKWLVEQWLAFLARKLMVTV